MIDTHAHLTDEAYAPYLDTMISEFPDKNLSHVFTVGFDFESSKKCVSLAEKYENVYAIIGVHPDEIHTLTPECEAYFRQISKHPKVIAIGEIGLDYHFVKDNKLKQAEAFIKQLKIADECGLPVVIHNRDSVGDMLEILKNNKNLLNNGGIIHCFNESLETFKEFKKLGFIVGLGGVVTFKNARNAVNLIQNMELTDFVLETDCPYLTPEPLRGKVKNQPAYTCYVMQKIADIKNVSDKVIDDCTTNNALNLFKKVKR